jgi:hypothetical protein
MLISIIYYYRVECRKENLNGYFMNGSIFKVILESCYIEIVCLVLE